MLSFIILGFIGLSSIWVFWDASTNRIGDISAHVAGFRFSATDWAVFTLFLWPAAFPWYIRLRPRLIYLAREFPVDTTKKHGKTAAISLLALGSIGVSVAFPLLD